MKLSHRDLNTRRRELPLLQTLEQPLPYRRRQRSSAVDVEADAEVPRAATIDQRLPLDLTEAERIVRTIVVEIESLTIKEERRKALQPAQPRETRKAKVLLSPREESTIRTHGSISSTTESALSSSVWK